MLSWTGTTDLEGALARLVIEHDQRWDAMTDRGFLKGTKKDPEALYHWSAAEACETVLADLRSRPSYATLCPPACGCRGNGERE